ncbi:MAG: hypothetical protein WD577_08035 [Bacteroidales bacterium]
MGLSVLFGRSIDSSQSFESEIKKRLHLLLGMAVVMHAAGLFAVVFGHHQSSFGGYLFLVIGMPHAQAFFIEKITVSLFLLMTLAGVLRPRTYLLIPVMAYVLFEAYAGYYQGGYRFSDWTLATHALRYLTPLALLVLFFPAEQTVIKPRWLRTSAWLLRLGLVFVFFSHGLESFWGNPQFIDFLIGTSWNLFNVRIPEAMVTQILKVIGLVDIAVAAALLIRPWRAVLWWMAFWGLLTAFSRITTLGWGAYYEVLLRASHVLVPLAFLEINKYWHAHSENKGKEIPTPNGS